MRYRATIAYDGTAYHGFQRQSNASSVQATLESALALVSGDASSITGSGRTDAGVHASGQVVAFDLDWKHKTSALRSALNVNLPSDIRVLEIGEADASFHPRFDARSRTYQYRVYTAPVADPLRRMYTWHLPHSLNVAAMQEAAEHLIGTYDFSSFGSPPQGDNATRTVILARWDRADDEIHFTIRANAFLYRMVRRIVGTLVIVGRGRMTANTFRDILAACDPNRSGPTAPPHGLTLTVVSFK
jgi:tRNA pseudouridine38-40 synthase